MGMEMRGQSLRADGRDSHAQLSDSCDSLPEVTSKGNQLSPSQRLSEVDRPLPGSPVLFTTSPSCSSSSLFLDGRLC